MIIVGGNDVTHRLPASVSTTHLHDAITALRERGAEVVVGTFNEPEAMFSMDRFHPSSLGYRRTADALLPAVCRAARAAG